jgi:hypothetical protein
MAVPSSPANSNCHVYTLPPIDRARPLSALGRFAAWQVASGLRAETPFERIEGAKLIVSRGMTARHRQYLLGLHDSLRWGFLPHLLRS